MSNSKMLIDASHLEETRVVVVRGGRVDEFDFESQARKQLRGNIYLAKVTRVEPSLQAAFVDYGGNRHGFLAFSEIHPDYCQIPIADRQALLAEEEAMQVEGRDEDERPQKTGRGRRSTEAETVDELDQPQEQQEAAANDDATVGNGEAELDADADSELRTDTEAATAADKDADDKRNTRRPRTRRTKRAKATDKVAVSDENPPAQTAEPNPADSECEPSTPPKSDQAQAASGDDGTDPVVDEKTAEVEKKAPKRRRRSRTVSADNPSDSLSEPVAEPEEENPAVEAKQAEAEQPDNGAVCKPETVEPSPPQDHDEETDLDPVQASEPEAETAGEQSAPAETNGTDDGAPKAKRARSRRRSRGRKPNGNDERGNDDDPSGEEQDDVESVGSEDALEEVPQRRRMLRRQYKIQEVIKRRQILLVQVVKEERGNKGAALTTYLSLAGRYSVLMPNTARGGGISRKITNATDRKRLKTIAAELEVPQGMGVILRTAGASRTKAEVKRDFEYLLRLWENVRSLTLESTAPCLVYEEGSLIKRSIRDLYDRETSEILVSGEEGYREARGFMQMLMPSHARHVKQYKEDLPILAHDGVETQLEKMLVPQVTLKSGGYLVINQTEALVAIDVNSGRSTREHSIENTALQTNLEAAQEVARQLRLRDLAGLIVIDFIDMEEKRNNRAVEKRLKEHLKNDRARIQVGRISHFGLLEMSRQRIRASVLDSTMVVCQSCEGTGHIRSASQVGLSAIRAIKEHLLRNRRFNIRLRASVDIALYVLNHKRENLTELERQFGVSIVVIADASVQANRFTIEKAEAATGEGVDIRHIQPDSAVIVESGDEEEVREDSPAVPRRRRRRGGARDAATGASAEVTAAAPGASEEKSDSEDGEAEGRRKRRGKRGGRRSRGAASSTDAGPKADATSLDNATNGQTEAAVASEPDLQNRQGDQTPEIAAAKIDLDNGDVAEIAEVQTKAAPQEPKDTKTVTKEPAKDERPNNRRPTRRPRKNGSSTIEASAEPIEPSVEIANMSVDVSETPEPIEAPDDKKAAGKSRRTGWWQGGGFFS